MNLVQQCNSATTAGSQEAAINDQGTTDCHRQALGSPIALLEALHTDSAVPTGCDQGCGCQGRLVLLDVGEGPGQGGVQQVT